VRSIPSPALFALLLLACSADWSLPAADHDGGTNRDRTFEADASREADAAPPRLPDAATPPRPLDAGAMPDASDGSAQRPDAGELDAGSGPGLDAGACPDGGDPRTGCVASTDPCATASCGANAKCSVVDGGARCSCNDNFTGDGKTCVPVVDPCTPSPCAMGLDCKPNGSAYSCVSSCSPNCATGAPCGQDADCSDDATCDRTGNVCVRPCTSQLITSRMDLDRARFCSEYSGDLTLQTTFEELTAADLPYLRRVFGAIKGGPDSRLTSLTLPGLLTVGDVNLFESPALRTVSMPALTTIGTLGKPASLIADPRGPALFELSMPKLVQVFGDINVNQLQVERIDLGSLQTVNGRLTLVFLQRLNTLKLGALKRVNTQFALSVLLRVPYSQVSFLMKAADAPMFSDIGCCNAGTDKYMCNGAYLCE
jgi:hypothetical protein